jgi:lipopolysaccharide export system ATP-binding protein
MNNEKVKALKLTSNDGGLEVKNLRKSYKKKPVLRDVSLFLKRGEAVALLGPNGTGKTTCFYAIAGLINADAGEIKVNNINITGLPMYRRAQLGIGYLPQESSIFRGLTVEKNILAVLEITLSSRSERKLQLDALLAEFSITHLRQTPALALSGGERRRVEIARCLASQPEYILLDEPFAGVDPIAVGEIRNLVAQLKKRGVGVLITDHNVRETLEIVDRAYILHEGNVIMSGIPDDVVKNQSVRKFYLGEKFQF